MGRVMEIGMRSEGWKKGGGEDDRWVYREREGDEEDEVEMELGD